MVATGVLLSSAPSAADSPEHLLGMTNLCAVRERSDSVSFDFALTTARMAVSLTSRNSRC